jgi:prepilin signal peptidase PulO-like enzyme (type II secretory pathway)
MQRVIGIVLGAIVTYLLLAVMIGMNGDSTVKFGAAVVIGAIVSLLWPWVIGFFLVRRAKQRRENQIDKEVDKRMSEKG